MGHLQRIFGHPEYQKALRLARFFRVLPWTIRGRPHDDVVAGPFISFVPVFVAVQNEGDVVAGRRRLQSREILLGPSFLEPPAPEAIVPEEDHGPITLAYLLGQISLQERQGIFWVVPRGRISVHWSRFGPRKNVGANEVNARPVPRVVIALRTEVQRGRCLFRWIWARST